MQVKQVCDSIKSLNPVSCRNASLKHKRPHNIIHSVNDAFDTPILWSGVRVGQAHGDALLEEKGAGASIVKLTVIVTLNAFNGAAELSVDVSKEV
jgi:hypothetical protein